MNRRVIFSFLILGIFGLIQVSCNKSSNDTVNIGAIVALTGPASFLGGPQVKTLKMLEEKINNSGGINGKKLNIIIKDSQGQAAKAISFARQLIEENSVLAIIGPSTSGETLQIKNICQKMKVPLLSMAAAEKIVNPISSYIFKVAPKDSHVARRILEYMKKQNFKKIAVLTSNTGFGNEGKRQLTKLAKEYKIDIIISEVYDKKATDLTGIITKIKSKEIDAIVNWSIVPAQSLIAKTMKQLKLNKPLFQSHGFGNIKYAISAGAPGNGTIFPCSRIFIAKQLPVDHPQRKVILDYISDYTKKYNEPISTFGGHAYDSLTMIVKVITDGATNRQMIQQAIENLHDFPGTAGIFNFTAKDHNGLSIDCLALHIVKDQQFELLPE